MSTLAVFLVLFFIHPSADKEARLHTDVTARHSGDPDWMLSRKLIVESEEVSYKVVSYGMNWIRTNAGLTRRYKSQSETFPPGFLSERKGMRSGDVIEIADVKVVSPETNDTLLFTSLNETQQLSWKIR